MGPIEGPACSAVGVPILPAVAAHPFSLSYTPWRSVPSFDNNSVVAYSCSPYFLPTVLYLLLDRLKNPFYLFLTNLLAPILVPAFVFVVALASAFVVAFASAFVVALVSAFAVAWSVPFVAPPPLPFEYLFS